MVDCNDDFMMKKIPNHPDFIRTGAKLDLFAFNSIDTLRNIPDSAKVTHIAFQYSDGYRVFHVKNLLTTNFVQSPIGDNRQLVLSFDRILTLSTFDKNDNVDWADSTINVSLLIRAFGRLNLETGECEVHIAHPKLMKLVDKGMEYKEGTPQWEVAKAFYENPIDMGYIAHVQTHATQGNMKLIWSLMQNPTESIH